METTFQVVVGSLAIWALIIGVPIFFVILFLLPEDAYGEENVKVSSSAQISALRRVQVFVLGDIGRSPRMQYHALSIANHGITVDLIGYTDSKLHPAIETHANIHVFQIDKTPTFLQTSNKILFLILGPLKVIFQFFSIWQILGHRTRPAKWMLVQNPPSIPVLLIASWICWLRKTDLVVDWHNFGYSILALKLGEKHPLARISRFYEKFWASSAVTNFVVSDAMNRKLKRDFGVKAPVITLHDRPMGDFQPMDAQRRTNFLSKLEITEDHAAELAAGRKKLLVSSTSWTPDEDFSVLLEALVGYSKLVSNNNEIPALLVIITGKGPQKQMYLDRITRLEKDGLLHGVKIRTAWLSNTDYASLLAASDLGVSLHTSSSGVDLPMKVVDMFGAGIPVVGWSFEAWPELVKEGVNGYGFGSVDELTDLLVRLFGSDPKKLHQIKGGALEENKHNWDIEWNRVAAPIFGLSE